MNKSDMPSFLSLMTGLGTLYGKPINEMLIELYWRTLQQFEFAEVVAAMEAHITNPDTGQFMPKPADFIRYLEGSSQTQSLQAWTKVLKAISSVGGYSSVIFDDPIIHAVINDMGGWVRLCHVMEDELPFRANEFQTRYRGYVLHPPMEYPTHLVGIHEQQNSMHGYGTAEPVRLTHERKSENRLNHNTSQGV